MKKILLLTLLTSCYAYTETERYVEKPTVEENIQYIIDQTYCKSLLESIHRFLTTHPESSSVSEEEYKKLVQKLLLQINYVFQSSTAEFTKLYRKYFSEDEIQQIVDHYKSPLGQKLAKALGPISLRLSEIMQPKLAYLITQFEGELAKLGVSIE